MAELFKNFEVNREARWPIVARLLCGSIALHLTLIAGAMYIPPLREAFNIAALVGRSGYVDKAYRKTAFGEDIQMVEASPKFQYPPGYFATGLPEASPTPTVDPNAPRIISQAKDLKPESSPSPVASPAPSSTPVVAQSSGSPGAVSNKGEVASNQKADDQKIGEGGKSDAQKQLEQVAADNNVDLPEENEINRQPIKDLVVYANELKAGGKLDFEKSFEVVIEGELDAQGKLHNPTIKQKSGDQNLAGLATKAIGALNESGLLGYLKQVNDGKPTRISLTVSQNSEALLASLESELGSEDSASGKARAFNLMMSFAQQTREGKDEEILLKSTKASAVGRNLVFHFSMPRQTALDLIKKQLAANNKTKPD
jgi:hypothetical protein